MRINYGLWEQIFFWGIKILKKYESKLGKTIKELKSFAASDSEFKSDVQDLAKRVENFAISFDIPGKEDI